MIIDMVFMPGSYGHYFAWNIYTYSNLNETNQIKLPFSSTGNSHSFYEWKGRMQHKVDDLIGNDVIYLQHNPEKLMEYIDNDCYKNIDSDHEPGDPTNFFLPRSKFNPDMTNWGDNPDGVQIWQFREWLSYFLPENLKSVNNGFVDINWQGRNVITVSVDLILNNMRAALDKVFIDKGLRFNNCASRIEETHAQFLSLQKNIGLDERLKRYVDLTLGDVSCEIPNLSLLSQAWIQHRLRQRGVELECYELNDFPNSTVALKKRCIMI